MLASAAIVFVASLLLYPLLGVSFFPRTDAGQFIINLKAPSGTRLDVTGNEVAKVEKLVREVVAPKTSASSSPTSAPSGLLLHLHHQLRLPHSLRSGQPQEDHKTGSYEYMARVRERICREMPQLTAYFQSGGMVDAVLNLGLPAPIDVQVAAPTSKLLQDRHRARRRDPQDPRRQATSTFRRTSTIPALRLDVDRTRAAQLGLDQQRDRRATSSPPSPPTR